MDRLVALVLPLTASLLATTARHAHAWRCAPTYVPTLTLSFDGPIAGLAAPGGDVAFVVEDGDCRMRHARAAAQLVATVASSPQGPFASTPLRDHGRRLVWRAPPTPGRYFLRIAPAPGTWPARVVVAAPAQVVVDVAPADSLRRVALRLPTGEAPPTAGWLQLLRDGVPEGWTPPRVALPWGSRVSSRTVALPAGRWQAFDAVRVEHRSDDRPPATIWRFTTPGGRPPRAVVTVDP